MCFKITNCHLFHKYKIRLTCQVVKFKNVELIVNMFVRFALDAQDARQDAILAVLISGQKLLWIFEINCAKFIIAGG